MNKNTSILLISFILFSFSIFTIDAMENCQADEEHEADARLTSLQNGVRVATKPATATENPELASAKQRTGIDSGKMPVQLITLITLAGVGIGLWFLSNNRKKSKAMSLIDELRWALKTRNLDIFNEAIDSGIVENWHLQALFDEFTGLEQKDATKMNAKKLQLLLNSHARQHIDINKTDKIGNTALMIPVYYCLLLKGCEFLADRFRPEGKKKIIEHHSRNQPDYRQLVSIIDLLLDAGADTNIVNADGNSLLKGLVRLFGENDPRVLKIEAENRSAEERRIRLLTAAGVGEYEHVRELLAQKAYVDTRDTYGSTPLMHAAFRGHTQLCRLLFENDADIDATDYRGRTALTMAVRSGHEDVVLALLTSIPPLEQKKILKIIVASLLAVKKGKPRLPKNIIDSLITPRLIDSQIKHWFANQIPGIQQSADQVVLKKARWQLVAPAISKLLKLSNPETCERIRKEVQNNMMRIIFGAPKGWWSATMESYKEQKVINNSTTKETCKEQKEVYKGGSMKSYYRILGVPVDATQEQINETFEQRIQPLIHETYQTGISSEHARLAEAWMILNDPQKRAAYDRTLTVKIC